MSEIIRNFLRKLYAWALPSALAIIAAWVVLYWQNGVSIPSYSDKSEYGPGIITLFLGLTSVLAVSLSAISTQLYRFLEGYTWPSSIREWGKLKQLDRKSALRANVDSAKGKLERAIAEDELARYPLEDGQLLPTRFGNAIRAFETYGRTRFNLDSQTLWHELYAVAPKYLQVEIESARSSVDFFVAVIYLSSVFSISCLLLGVLDHFNLNLILISILSLLLAFGSHWFAIRAIDAWAEPIRALVNLGRPKLADSFGFMIPQTIEEEKFMWGLVANYINDPKEEYGKALNVFRAPGAVNATKKRLKITLEDDDET